MSLLIVSCSKQDSIYDPSIIKKQAKEVFLVNDIDPNQDWNLLSKYSVSVSINQKSNENYNLKIYTSNPFNTSSEAKLIALKENVKDGSSTVLNFVGAKALKAVYVVVEDSKYNRSMKSVELVNSSASLSWGGNVTKSSTVSRAVMSSGSRAIPSAGVNYPTEIPPGALNFLTTDYNQLKSNSYTTPYYIDGTSATVSVNNFWWNDTGGVISLYIKGNVRFPGSVNANYNLYLLPGANVTFETADNLAPTTTVYICQNSTLTANANLVIGSKIYNNGTFNAKDLTFQNTVLNSGNVNCGNVSLTNSGAYSGALSNEGSFSAQSIVLSSNATIENFSGATMNVSGLTNITNPNPLVNSGTFITGSLKAVDNGSIVNHCILKVIDQPISLDGVSVTIDGASYMYLKGISSINNTAINMGAKSLLVVDSDFNFGGGGSNTITGPTTDERALVYINGNFTTTGNIGWKLLTLSGNVDRAYKSGMSLTEISEENGAASVDFSNVVLGTESGCSRSFSTSGGGPVVPPVIENYTFAFEDMFKEVGDYDFNDVVVKVAAVPTDGKIKVKLTAAGAAKNLYVYYKLNGGSEKTLFGGQEVHKAFGAAAGTMVNTVSVTYAAVEDEIAVPADYSISNLDIYIKEANSTAEVHIPAFTSTFVKGDAPYAILVPTDWSYPAERELISHKYPRFVDWAKDAKVSLDWYTN
ncbi:DUF4842 domain-containing protein [Phocaeicola paurosaccharolyticus]|uniref:DUF4842 domain-containing protein n=1 Tax=Phocaeicola paurosaccharolyticus TaxID=732242 RepID=UPI000469EFED|nr:DUF4842 domain-containing protein [Phocaeicola paurosaccharolyticus]